MIKRRWSSRKYPIKLSWDKFMSNTLKMSTFVDIIVGISCQLFPYRTISHDIAQVLLYKP